MFLEVKFHDNDFGGSLIDALERLWKMIHVNNDGFTVPPFISDIFIKLDQAGALKTMIERLWVLEHLANDVEYATRGLYDEQTNWEDSKIEGPFNDTFYSDYLSCELEFHDTKEFADKWENSEHACLDLSTGKAMTF